MHYDTRKLMLAKKFLKDALSKQKQIHLEVKSGAIFEYSNDFA